MGYQINEGLEGRDMAFYLYFTIHCVGLLAAALLIAGLRCVDRYAWPLYLYFTIHCVGLLAAALLIAGLMWVDIPGHSTCTSPSTVWVS